MPVALARTRTLSVASLRERRQRRGVSADRGRRLRVDLVNNMPDAALFSTQRQFVKLLEEGARNFDVTLGLTTLTSLERSAEARAEMAELYRAPAHFRAAPPDAVIFTGAEPRAPELDQEPYWRELTGLFDAARAQTFATLASCLAAHALALHRDGVRRRRSPDKWSGLYPLSLATPHALTRGLRAGGVPHSRWNGLDEAELVASNYLVLTRAGAAGVDMFVKEGDHLSLFFQGHPEYDGDTLAREYRRDVTRALEGGRLPRLPVNYFDPETERRLEGHVERMMRGEESPHLPNAALAAPQADWRRRAGRVLENWFNEISARKQAANGLSLRVRWGG
jgi:homoserine O-succinyltransferase